MRKNADLSKSFMQIAEVMVKESEGRLRIAYKEKSDTSGRDLEVKHFLKLNNERISLDIEEYVKLFKKDKFGYGLPQFLIALWKIRMDCPISYREGSILLRGVGNKVYKGKILDNWNFLFIRDP